MAVSQQNTAELSIIHVGCGRSPVGRPSRKPASTGARTVIWSPKAANRKRTSTVGSRTLWPRRIASPLRSISGTGRGPPRHVGGSPVVASKVPRHRSYHEKKYTGISDLFMMVDLSKIKSYSVHRYAQSTLVLSRYYSRRDSFNSCYRKLKRPKRRIVLQRNP